MDYHEAQEMIAAEMLAKVFGAEWQALTKHRRALVARDFTDTDEEKEITASEYARRIGANNLASYADCMEVRERKGW
jgi:hypothetical protein